MDLHERLAAINEEITRLKRSHRVQKKKQTRKANKIFKAIDNAANTQEDPKEVEARLAAFYDKQDKSIFGESTETEKMDQEFDDAKKALSDAGIKHKGLRAVGSMNREKNTFKVDSESAAQARKVLKKFPNSILRDHKEVDMDPFQRLEAINETLTRIFTEDVDPDKYVSVGDRKTVEFGRRTRDLSPEDKAAARKSADRKTARDKKKAPKGSRAAHNVIADAGRRYRVGTQRPTDPDDPKHENLRIAAAINAAISRGMSAD